MRNIILISFHFIKSSGWTSFETRCITDSIEIPTTNLGVYNLSDLRKCWEVTATKDRQPEMARTECLQLLQYGHTFIKPAVVKNPTWG